MFRHFEPIVPRNGLTLVVGIVARISGCQNQKEMSLDDQVDHAKETIEELYDGPVEYDIITTVAKGERLDRPELEEVEASYCSKRYDFFVFDDLSRLIRGGEAARLLGVGVDHGTRTLCLDDGIDTADSTWEEDALNACSENVAHNERTSKRIKHKSMNRFKKYGRPTGRPIAGCIVPAGAKSYDDWLKDEEVTSVIHDGMKLLKESLDCAIVADSFNEEQFPVGPYARRKSWNGPMVRKFFGNPLLKGMARRGERHTVKNHGSGRRVSIKNPKGPVYYSAPHLAHLTEKEFDELNALLDAKNAHHRRATVDGVDPLLNRSRRHSVFPGMHSRCWYCGFHHVWGGNGITENLMCNNAREWRCWHSIGFSGPRAVELLVSAICEQLPRLDQFNEQFAAMVALARSEVEGKTVVEWKRLRTDEMTLSRQKVNLAEAIKESGPRPLLLQELDAVEAREQDLLLRRHRLERRRQNGLALPESLSVMRGMLEEEFLRLTHESPEFTALMRMLVPDFYVHAVGAVSVVTDWRAGGLNWCWLKTASVSQ
ncbi:MAG: recombinase family protein [Planctomycetes bacterium]|nr:recombinase family protein [Planctomycetota bacterium]